MHVAAKLYARGGDELLKIRSESSDGPVNFGDGDFILSDKRLAPFTERLSQVIARIALAPNRTAIA
jgi:hypothetical protein